MKGILVIALLLSVFISKIACSEESDQIPPEPSKGRFLFLPFFYYTPETKVAAGVASTYIFRLSKKKPQIRPSSISPLLVYTQRRQFRCELLSNFYLNNNDFQILSHLKFKHYPDYFFGIGNENAMSDKEAYTTSDIDFSVSAYHRFSGHLFLGMRYHVSSWKILDKEPLGKLECGNVPGGSKGTISGLSLLFLADSRDHIYLPGSGFFIEAGATYYAPVLGSSFKFSSYTVNARNYLPLFHTHVLATQILLDFKSGEVPFPYLAKLGGQNVFRGYYEGRFRDKDLIALQLEYRFPLFWRLGMAGFTNIGQVASGLADFKLDNTKFISGFGLRYLFSKSEKITIRLDLAFQPEGSTFYLSIFEAF